MNRIVYRIVRYLEYLWESICEVIFYIIIPTVIIVALVIVPVIFLIRTCTFAG